MYETLSNYLKIPRCALEDGNQLTKAEKTKAKDKKTTNKPAKKIKSRDKRKTTKTVIQKEVRLLKL